MTREGVNEVEVMPDSRFTACTYDRVLQSGELFIAYKEPPVPVQGQM